MSNPFIVAGEGIKAIFGFLIKRKEKQAETHIIKQYKDLVKAVEYAEKYIRAVSKTPQGNNKTLKKLEDKFFKYN